MDVSQSRMMPVRNPRTGEIDYHFPVPSEAELASIAGKLREAQPAWEALGVERRVAVMRRWADSLEKHQAAISDAEATDTGRQHVSREIVSRMIANLRQWCDMAPALIEAAARTGESSVRSSIRYRTQLSPYQLVGVISPWNAPIFLATIDAIPALLAGCAVLVKPSEVAPRFVDPLVESIREIPELSQVLAFVRGAAETGKQLIEQVDVVCFTGSVPNGRRVGEACARRFIPAFLELGGKDAAIVTETADVERAVHAVLRGGVLNTGQICHSIERVYVQQPIFDRFVERIVEEAKKIRPSYPLESGGHIGPFIMEQQAKIVDQQIDDAVSRGARILAGGKSEVLGGGVFMHPTVLVGVNHDMQIMREETFGPVLPIMPFETEADAIRLANDSEFGLSGAVIAGSVEEAMAIAEKLNAGAITLQDTTLSNTILLDTEKCYFGNSGLGEPRTGRSAILRFLRRKAIIMNPGPTARMEMFAERGAPEHA